MSERLIDPILARLQEQESARITEQVRMLAGEYRVVDEALVSPSVMSERAKNSSDLINGHIRTVRSRGFLKNFFMGKMTPLTEWYMEDFEADFVHSTNSALHDLVKEDKPLHREIGHRTLPFGLLKEFVGSSTFEQGWQVGIVTKRQVQTRETQAEATGVLHYVDPDKGHSKRRIRTPIITPIKGPFPVRIWEYAIERHSGETQRRVAYDVHPVTGEVQSYTGVQPDDELIAIGKGAVMCAFQILGQAQEYFEQ